MQNNEKVKIINADCMEIMKEYPDKYFDIAIVDVPYGKNCDLRQSKSRWHEKNGFSKMWLKGKQSKWNIEPEKEYFDELFRISKNQVIWGANHFISKMPKDSSCWLIWDKKQRVFSFADAELAWTSFNKSVRIFDLPRSKNNNRIHPTQKPVELYKWILKQFAQTEMKILDTHLGSGSSLIAADSFGISEFVGIEIDTEYYEQALKRYNEYKAQLQINY